MKLFFFISLNLKAKKDYDWYPTKITELDDCPVIDRTYFVDPHSDLAVKNTQIVLMDIDEMF